MLRAPAPDSAAPAGDGRWCAAGKFLRKAGEKQVLRGVSYGPFSPNAAGEPYPEEGRLRSDFAHIRELGFNTVRLYEAPTATVLAAAEAAGLSLLVSIPWAAHVDFLRTRQRREEVEQQVLRVVRHCRDHPSVLGFLVGNEIEKTLVRWLGPPRVLRFLEGLIALGRAEAPDHLFSYATYPSTEYLIPRNADFVAVNVFLESPEALSRYLTRLHNLAGNKPLVITEFGLDARQHGEAAQADAMRWLLVALRRAAVAGHIWFSYTDDWFRGGKAVADWEFGLVTARRQPRPICAAATEAEPPAAANAPGMSVIVCTRNGSATLTRCLDSLTKLRYPNYEIVLIDDGSTHDIGAIAMCFPQVRFQRQDGAGLSAARNRGAHLATGEILVYTDDDCFVDEDWLAQLATAFADPACVAAGGPNVPPPPRNRTEAVVAAAPGAPAHVLLNDVDAEHLPGCNLAVRKQALLDIGGFDAVFTSAGDDVDICWRLRAAGGRLRFVPGAMVWHHRRFSIRGYLRQQRGYGNAEGLLMKTHPERFAFLGGARWHGAIYGDASAGAVPAEGAIYHGPLGHGLFQTVYSGRSSCWLHWLSGVAWLALAGLLAVAGLYKAAFLIVGLSLVLAWVAARRQPLPPYFLDTRGRLLLWLLCWLQPVVRESARLGAMARLRAWPNRKADLTQVFVPDRPRKWTVALDELAFWSSEGKDRDAWIHNFQRLLRAEELPFRADDGWRWFDVEVNPEGVVSPAVISTSEYHGDGRCVTRVRLLLRLRWLLLAAGIAVLMAVTLALLPNPRFLLLTLSASALLLGICALIQRAAMRRCAARAAAEAGLTRIKE
jgi:glycosyltransferase involved in cell wall biosynthesis/exo-beta-1,3-glucanase (GH17 family)